MGTIRTFRDLVVWQKGMDFAAEVYRLTLSFPKEELYGLVIQLRRCVISVPSNIAEGFSRQSTADFQRFVEIALGSLYEAQTQMELAYRLTYCDEADYKKLYEQAREIERMLCSLKSKLRGRKAS